MPREKDFALLSAEILDRCKIKKKKREGPGKETGGDILGLDIAIERFILYIHEGLDADADGDTTIFLYTIN